MIVSGNGFYWIPKIAQLLKIGFLIFIAILWPNNRRTREDKSAELYRKHMKSLQMESCTFSMSGSQVGQWVDYKLLNSIQIWLEHNRVCYPLGRI